MIWMGSREERLLGGEDEHPVHLTREGRVLEHGTLQGLDRLPFFRSTEHPCVAVLDDGMKHFFSRGGGLAELALEHPLGDGDDLPVQG